MNGRLLIVDDETLFSRSIQRALERTGHQVAVEESAEAALDALGRHRADLVLLDLRLPGMSGLDLLRVIREQAHEIPIIVVSASSDARTALDAMRLGAFDYVIKPVDLDELRLVVARALDHARLSRELSHLRERDQRDAPPGSLLGDCPEMLLVREHVERIARMERPHGGGAPSVLVLGETGTGKGLVARAIHRASPRASGPFIEIHCGRLLDADLFGSDRTALPGAPGTRLGLFDAADRGTLFLDEIGALSPPAQTRLLALFEEDLLGGRSGGPRVNVRIIAASNKDLGAAQSSSSFRPELFHRLKVLTVELPPLRARGADVILLAEHFACRHAEQYGLPARRLAVAARDVLLRYAWPGNVRELANEIERAVLLEAGSEIALEHLGRALEPPSRRTSVGPGRSGSDIEVDLPAEGAAFETIERRVLERALELAGGNVTRAARLLRLSRDTLRYRIDRLGIAPPADE